MAGRIVLGGLTTLNLSTHLDPMTLDLYDFRELVTTPSYTASTPKMTFDAGYNLCILGTTAAVGGGADKFSVAGTIGLSGQQINANPGVGNPLEIINRSTSGYLNFYVAAASIIAMQMDATGNCKPGTDNLKTLGSAGNRWSVVYAGTGAINTSDAREKDAVAPLVERELEAAKQLAREIGTFRFLDAVARKGDASRVHIGMTVQRAIDVMRGQGLEPMRYGFICYDQWPQETIPARTESRRTGICDASGSPLMEEVIVEPAREIPAGNRFGFRIDELLMFIARGFEARLAALEEAR